MSETYESVPVGLFAVAADGVVSACNATFRQLFPAAALGVPAPTALGEAILADVATLAGLNEPTGFQVRDQRAIGVGRTTERHLAFTATRSDKGLEGSVSDVTSRVVAERRIEHLVDHDPLTGALNQRGLDNATNGAILRASQGTPSALADLHIDRFKMVNDLYGLATGDAVLAAVHDRIHREFDRALHIARIGDTFKLILPGLDGPSALQLTERILRTVVYQPFDIDGKRLNLTASIGLVSITDAMNSRDVMTAASHASADAKAHGRNRIVQALPADLALKGFFEDLSVQATLRDRLDSDRFFLEFQPIVDLRHAYQALSFEVLVRMRDEKGTVISPGRFIPAAERNGQISMIDRWVLEATLAWLAAHPRQAATLNYATVNLSGASLNDARFVDEAFALIAKYPKLASKLCFEITETVALADRRATRQFADRVHSMGGYIALDDFGAGYTSFTYLKEIDADIIKIDGSFVCDLHENPHNMAITRMITDLAHQLGKRCVAEWVEKPETVAALMALSVDYAQGFAMGRPMKTDAFLNVRSSADMVQNEGIKSLLRGDAPVRDLAVSAGNVLRPAMF